MADIRKLKDSVTESLKKGKFEKAVDQLEELIGLEPREIAHRLKLGDAYRKIGEREKSIASYQFAAKAYGDEGQLIKAIAAVKVILEIDPDNDGAQEQLADMTQRRFGKHPAQQAPPPAKKRAEPTDAIELDDTPTVRIQRGGKVAPPPSGAQELELDEPKSAPSRAPAPEPAVLDPQPDMLSAEPRTVPIPGRRGRPLAEPLQPIEAVEAIELPPEPPKPPPKEPEPIEGEPIELELIPIEEEKPVAPAAKAVPEPELTEVEIDLGEPLPEPKPAPPVAAPPPAAAPPARAAPRPIGDLLHMGQDEGLIELVTAAADEEAEVLAGPDDLDQAFGTIVDESKVPVRKVPPRIPLFSELSQEAFIELVNRLDYRVVQPGDVILRQGDPGMSFFVIAEGKVRVYKEGPGGAQVDLARLEDGAFFGEMAMLSGAPRSAGIAAVEETHLLEVSDHLVRQLAEKHPQVVGVLKSFFKERLLNNVMAISPLFRDFDAAERKALMARFKMSQAKPGDVLIAQGQRSEGLFVLLHGIVTVTHKTDTGSLELAKLKEGDIFGEMSALSRGPASATVTAAVPSIVLKLPRDQFQEMILTHPQILELVSQLSDERRSATAAIVEGRGPGVDGMAYV